MFKSKHYSWFLATALFLLAASTATVNAQTPDGTTIYGCYLKSEGQLRRVTGPGQCRPSEIALSWNVAGPKGDKGDNGEQGVQGIKGDKGEKGDVGAQGVKGDKGDTGEQGLQGVKGDKGDTGEQGLQGVTGDKGDTGEQGLQGLKGDKGDTGEQGLQGLKGDKGDTGDRGEQGTQGLKGDKGEQGEQGLKGDQGDRGPAGDSGKSISVGLISSGASDTYCAGQGGIKVYHSDDVTQTALGYVCNAMQGAQGAQGAKGDKGDKGDTGASGSGGGIKGLREFTEPGEFEFVAPGGVTHVLIEMWGAGGGGGGTVPGDMFQQYEGAFGGGGGGGGAYTRTVVAVEPGKSYFVIVGEGGEGGAAGTQGISGENGEGSSFQTFKRMLLASAPGGAGGKGGNIHRCTQPLVPGTDGQGGAAAPISELGEAIRRAGVSGGQGDAPEYKHFSGNECSLRSGSKGVGAGPLVRNPVTWETGSGGHGGSAEFFRLQYPPLDATMMSTGSKGASGYVVITW